MGHMNNFQLIRSILNVSDPIFLHSNLVCSKLMSNKAYIFNWDKFSYF